LSGGNQLGTITQPRTQRQAFNNTIRVPVGETVILGGVTYESISDNRNTLSFMDDKETASQNKNISSNSLFVVIRPTVILYKNIKGDK
jgi:type II secretory pathway component GspD/PulD (secretin)